MNISFTTKGDFDNVTRWLKEKSNNDIFKELDSVARDGTSKLSSATPRNTGETASGWDSKITKKGDVAEIAWTNHAHPEAGINIAKIIELGHGTGTGGYVPPIPYIKNAMEPVWKNMENKVTKELLK